MNNHSEVEISLSKLISFLLKKFPIILIISVLFSAAVFLFSRAGTVQTYTAHVSFYVGDSSSYEEQISMADDNFTINHTSQRNTQTLNTICYFVTSHSTLQAVCDKNNLPYSAQELSNLVSVFSPGDINAFSVNVTSSTADEAMQIAHAFAKTLPEELAFMAPSEELLVLDSGSVTSNNPSSNQIKKAVIAAFAVAFIIIFIYIFKFILDEIAGVVTINAADLNDLFPNIRILSLSAKKGFNQEAVNRLRSLLLLATADKKSPTIFGVTAPYEEKNRAAFAVDLAKSFAKLDKKTLLIDADLRSHTLSDLLTDNQTNGLSDILNHSVSIDECIQRKAEESCVSFSFLSAGTSLEGYVEKLHSSQLPSIIQSLQKEYDCIILNMTEIEAEIDAALVGKYTDGNIVFLCEDRCTRKQLSFCLDQINYASTPLLGFAVAKP